MAKSNGNIKKIELSWIVVSDINKAKKFFVDHIGLKIDTEDKEMGWLELSGHEGGAILGIAQANDFSPVSPGQNSITTFTVENIEKAVADLTKKGVELIGDILEIPGHVKMQLFADFDGNKFQLVENLESK